MMRPIWTKFAVLPLALVMSVGCSLAEDSASFDAELKIAENTLQDAREVQGAWRDTHKMIKQAIELKKAGQAQRALALLEQARRQAELGKQQAMTQKERIYYPPFLAR